LTSNTQYSISKLCEFSNITRSSYYSWLEVQQSKQNDSFIFIEDQKLKTLIPKVFKEYNGHGGARRIKKWLMKAHDLQVSRRRICRLLHELGLTVKPITKFKNKNVTPINDARIAKNHLQRGFNPLGPNQKWVSDITYIKTGQGWLFLVVFIDL